MRRYRHNKGYRYRLTNPPKALRKARLDNIAIVPASLLPFKTTWQKAANTLPKRGVLLERVEEVFKRLGYAVMNLPIEQVI
jgi:hypothetical protein